MHCCRTSQREPSAAGWPGETGLLATPTGGNSAIIPPFASTHRFEHMSRRILYIAPAIPTLTCTFIYREIFDLRDLGFQIDTVSMNTPTPDRVSEAAQPLMRTTLFLDQVPEWRKFHACIKALILHPISMIRCLRLFVTASPMKSFRDYRRLGYHWIEACYLAFRIKNSKPDHIHSHFITGATSISMFLSELIQVPFSFTMHASAIWIDPIALRTKLRQCKFCVSISEYNKTYVLQTYGEEWRSKFNIVHCGIVLPEAARQHTRAPKNAQSGPVQVLAVGQLMKRKGYDILIEAARLLRDKKVDVTWVIVGEGNQRPVIEELITRYHLQETVTMAGAQPHEKIPDFLAAADIFTLPCVIGDDNTRDGIPVSLMEAMAWQLPVVSTNIVGLPELIDSGRDGILVQAGDGAALAKAIEELASSEDLRRRLGRSGLEKVERDFNATRSAKQLGTLFAGN